MRVTHCAPMLMHLIPRWNGHVETIFAAKTRQAPNVEYERRLMLTPDGGTVSLDYHQLPPGKASRKSLQPQHT